jgi:hypothetical protein
MCIYLRALAPNGPATFPNVSIRPPFADPRAQSANQSDFRNVTVGRNTASCSLEKFFSFHNVSIWLRHPMICIVSTPPVSDFEESSTQAFYCRNLMMTYQRAL